jgi:hypothetical protein
MSLQLAVVSYIYIPVPYALKKRRGAVVMCNVARPDLLRP